MHDSDPQTQQNGVEEMAAASKDSLQQPRSQSLSQDSTDHVQPIITHSNPGNDAVDVEASAADRDLEPLYSVFTTGQKRWIAFLAALGSFFSPFTANIYFPALTTLADHFNVSYSLINLTITSYMIFQGIAPTFYGEFTDMAGRRPAYLLAFTIYLGANIGLALQNSYVALILLRCLQSSGSSGTVALAYGVIADVATAGERGTYMGLAGSGALIGPAVGPIIGGMLAEFLGWRAIFWFLTIFAGVFLLVILFALPETGRNVVGNGSIPPPLSNMSAMNYLAIRKAAKTEDLSRTVSKNERLRAQADLASKRHLRWPNPFSALVIIFEKDVAIINFYIAIVIAAFYDVIATIPTIYAQTYGFNDLQIGLCYIPFGVACAIASFVVGKLADYNYKRLAKKLGFPVDLKRGDDLKDFPIERARIQVILPSLAVGAASVLCYGWAMQQNANLAAPLILLAIMGATLTSSVVILSTLLVDLYPTRAATVTAANNLSRCLLGAGATAVIEPMLQAMGRGGCYSFIAGVIVVMSPLLWVEMENGPRWREERRLRGEKSKEKKEARSSPATREGHLASPEQSEKRVSGEQRAVESDEAHQAEKETAVDDGGHDGAKDKELQD